MPLILIFDFYELSGLITISVTLKNWQYNGCEKLALLIIVVVKNTNL